MIARLWSADTTPAQAPAYAEHLRAHVLPALNAIEGYAGATLLERTTPAAVEIIVITWWRSLEAIRGFSGADLEHAVIADEAARRGGARRGVREGGGRGRRGGGGERGGGGGYGRRGLPARSEDSGGPGRTPGRRAGWGGGCGQVVPPPVFFKGGRVGGGVPP